MLSEGVEGVEVSQTLIYTSVRALIGCPAIPTSLETKIHLTLGYDNSSLSHSEPRKGSLQFD